MSSHETPPGTSPDEPLLLRGFAVEGYGSLQRTVQVGPLAKLSFLVGRNNHGKSTILRASRFFSKDARAIPDIERWLAPSGARNPGPQPIFLSRQILSVIDEENYASCFPQALNDWVTFRRIALNTGLASCDPDDRLLVWTSLTDQIGIAPTLATNTEWGRALGLNLPLSNIVEGLLRAGGLSTNGFVPGPTWKLIPAFRETRIHTDVGPAPTPESGTNLIHELQRWQNPDSTSDSYETDQALFERLTALLRDVLEDDTAKPYIPFNSRAIQCTTKYYRSPLDLSELGDGIKQVMMIGAAALRNSNTFICLEEPEIHLHPGLQRKLMTHLRDRTDNQYLIATHSAHILDTAGSTIFHVTHDGRSSQIVASVRVDDLVGICEDLGYKASDLLQANYILWVEGPADRIYWRAWLKILDPVLNEGVHYAIMAYGGSLIADSSINGGTSLVAETAEHDLVDLMSLGRHCTVVIDSDKKSSDDVLRSTVSRILSESENSPGAHVVVIESARTVENLIPSEVLTKAVRKIHSRLGAGFTAPADPFSPPFDNLDTSPAKVRIAREAALDLRSIDQIPLAAAAVFETAVRIRSINGLPARAEAS